MVKEEPTLVALGLLAVENSLIVRFTGYTEDYR